MEKRTITVLIIFISNVILFNDIVCLPVLQKGAPEQPLVDESLDTGPLLKIYERVIGEKRRNIAMPNIQPISCVLSAKGRENEICCSCESTCMLTKDCCLDAFFQPSMNPLQYFDFYEQLADNVTKVCTPVIPDTLVSPSHKVQGVMMIAECLNKSIPFSTVHRKCTNAQHDLSDPYDEIPVIGADKQLYKNRFCAHCNGIQDYQRLKVSYSACKNEARKGGNETESNMTSTSNLNNKKITITEIMRSKSCTVKGVFHTLAVKPEICSFKRMHTNYEEFNGRCSKVEFLLCQSYVAVTRAYGQKFHNPTCAKCHLGRVTTTFQHCLEDMPKPQNNKGDLISPYSLLFSFTKIARVLLINTDAAEVLDSLLEEIKCHTEHFNMTTGTCNEELRLGKDGLNMGEDGTACQKYSEQLTNTKLMSKRDVCSEKEVKVPKDLHHFAMVEDIISITLLALSIIALLVTTVVYGMFSELRTVSGRFLMMFFLAVLFSDVTVLVGAAGKTSELCCKVVAVCLHYFSLSSQLWTLVIVFDLSLMVRCMARRNHTYASFWACNLCVWGSTTIVVGICVYLDQSGNNVIEYGSNNVCWIGSLYASIFSYLVPTLLAMSFNLVLLLIIYVESRKMTCVISENRAHAQKSISFASLMLKVVVLFGSAELLGLIQLRETNEVNKVVSSVFRLLYSTIRSSRGLFVFGVLVVKNREARRLMKQKSNDNPN